MATYRSLEQYCADIREVICESVIHTEKIIPQVYVEYSHFGTSCGPGLIALISVAGMQRRYEYPTHLAEVSSFLKSKNFHKQLIDDCQNFTLDFLQLNLVNA
jgi:hypothetical protein